MLALHLVFLIISGFNISKVLQKILNYCKFGWKAVYIDLVLGLIYLHQIYPFAIEYYFLNDKSAGAAHGRRLAKL